MSQGILVTTVSCGHARYASIFWNGNQAFAVGGVASRFVEMLMRASRREHPVARNSDKAACDHAIIGADKSDGDCTHTAVRKAGPSGNTTVTPLMTVQVTAV